MTQTKRMNGSGITIAVFSALLLAAGVAAITISAACPSWFGEAQDIGTWSAWRVFTLTFGILGVLFGIAFAIVAAQQRNMVIPTIKVQTSASATQESQLADVAKLMLHLKQPTMIQFLAYPKVT